jgi:hypothetical protein
VGKKLRRCHLSIEEVWTWAHYILALRAPMVGEYFFAVRHNGEYAGGCVSKPAGFLALGPCVFELRV